MVLVTKPFVLLCALWFQCDFLKLTRRLQAKSYLHWPPLPGFPWLARDSLPAELPPASPDGVKYTFLLLQSTMHESHISFCKWQQSSPFFNSGFETTQPITVYCLLPAATGRAGQSPSVLSGWCRAGSVGWSLGCAAPDTAVAGTPDRKDMSDFWWPPAVFIKSKLL